MSIAASHMMNAIVDTVIGNAKGVPRARDLVVQALAKKGLAHRLWGKGWALSPLGWQVFWKLNDRNMEGKC